jgi:glycosyltransferase involved in cell wall biosynthesis
MRDQFELSTAIAVLIPCYNEELTISKVVNDFREALPDSKIYVYDNNSTDRTFEVAANSGAIVRREFQQGKGHVVRRMFADIDADIYVLVDGDDTYDASAAPELINLLLSNNLDMVNGARVTEIKESYRPGHVFGNWLLTAIVAKMFGARFNDMLSGYRIFSRRYVKSFPAQSLGFEIETEFTVHTLELNLPASEVETTYKDRPHGSTSKLRTFRDGCRILYTITRLLKNERPLMFFSIIAMVLVFAGLGLTAPIVKTYILTGLVPRFPTAMLIVGLMILAALSFASGLILDTVTHGRRETRRLFYLLHAAPLPSECRKFSRSEDHAIA